MLAAGTTGTKGTLKERGFEEVGCKLTDNRMRTKKPAMNDVTDSAQALRSTKSRSQKMKHRHNNVDSTQNAKTSAVTTLDDRNVGCFFLGELKSCFETVPNVMGSLRVTKFVDSMYSELTMSLPPYRSRSVYLKERTQCAKACYSVIMLANSYSSKNCSTGRS